MNATHKSIARLFLHSREMLSLLKRAADVIAADNPYSHTVMEIDALTKSIEGK